MPESKGPRLFLCITGMPGAGKTTLAEALEELGFERITLGDVVRNLARVRGLEPTDENLGKLFHELRQTLGNGAVAALALKESRELSDRLVVDGIRSLDEVKEFARHGSTLLIAVHASPSKRFALLSKRAREDDPKVPDELQRRDQRELSVGLCQAIALADLMIVNDEDMDLEEFKRSAKKKVVAWLSSHGWQERTRSDSRG
jgi:dephospho-CoA kinase